MTMSKSFDKFVHCFNGTRELELYNKHLLRIKTLWHVAIRYSPVTTSHTRNLSRVVPRVIQREDKICHA